jgi:hypothetical protein
MDIHRFTDTGQEALRPAQSKAIDHDRAQDKLAFHRESAEEPPAGAAKA